MTMKDTIRGGHKSNFMEKRGHKIFNFKVRCWYVTLTVGPWADMKNGFKWKIVIVLKVRGGHGE